MVLPTFRRHRRNEVPVSSAEKPNGTGTDIEGAMMRNSDSDRTLTPTNYAPGVNIKRATRQRKTSALVSSFFFFCAVVFLILVMIGSTYNNNVLRDIYFFSLDLSNIVPQTVPNSILINSIARTLGLHDFYNVGLWGFCEGYNNAGVTYCSPPQTLYAFNPVEILLNELLAGATIALPAELISILNLIKVISHLMFGFFLTGACVSFVAVFLAPLALYSRWWSFPLVIFTFVGALLTIVATIIATVYAIIFRNVLTSQADLNIGVDLGVKMFAFMWTASACVLVAFLIQSSLSCCCASRRDVRTGRKKGSMKAWGEVPAGEEKKARKGRSRKFVMFRRH